MKRKLVTVVILLLVLMQIDKRNEISCCGQLGLEPLISRAFATHRYPWHVAIYHKLNERSSSVYQCGGTIISSNAVLTAAHCIPMIEANRVFVSLGRLNLDESESSAPLIRAAEIIRHPKYKSEDQENDIGIIRLSTNVKYNSKVQPICLWKESKTDLAEVLNKYGIVVGWGLTELGTVSNELLEAALPVVDHLTCLRSNRNLFGNYLSNTNYCAGTRNETSVCKGDSGGSMTFEDENGVYYIRGIVSVGPAKLNRRLQKVVCDPMQYAIFTDVAQYLPWIRSTINSESGASNTPAPITNKIKIAAGELCLDVALASNANGTPVQVAFCNGNAAQDWTINGYDHTIRAFGKCLDVADGSSANGASVQIYDCNGSSSQQWTVSGANDIVSLSANRCLDVRYPVRDGTHTKIRDCAGTSNQKWNVV